MSTVYEEQKDEDGFLYVQYSGESTFGDGFGTGTGTGTGSGSRTGTTLEMEEEEAEINMTEEA
jgi:hypothetical protein